MATGPRPGRIPAPPGCIAWLLWLVLLALTVLVIFHYVTEAR